MNHYKVLTLQEAADMGFEEAKKDLQGWRRGEDYICGLYEIDEDGTIVRCVFLDGIEPEDVILGRDSSPLVSEIFKLAKERDNWYEEAKLRAKNEEYWKSRQMRDEEVDAESN